MLKKVFCFLIVAMLLVLALPTIGLGSSSLYNVIDFKFHHKPNGIGYGNCPVYTAPSTSAYRAANGKASVDTNHDMYIGGFETGSGWLLVRYETSNGGVRVGYIPPNYINGFKTDIDRLKFSHIEQTATSCIDITDNPLNTNTSFATLSPGETYYILGKYTYYGNWWYVECYVNGQIARGFIDRDTTLVYNGSSSNQTGYSNTGSSGYTSTYSNSGNGSYTNDFRDPGRGPQGQRRIGTVRVQGEARIVRQNAGQEYNMVARVAYPDEYPCYDEKIGTNGRRWFLIYVDGVWGWISEGVSSLN